ncbi:MAG: phospholipase D family protein [bacterium]
MQYNFYIQDPHSQNPHYLIEAIIDQLIFPETILWRGIFAFASRPGIGGLLDDPDVRRFLQRGSTDLIIGIDAITDPAALEKLKELENEYENFKVKIFYKRMEGVFHPKIVHFIRNDGTQVIIVGSGNLTHGGLKNNIEAYSVFISEPGEEVDLGDMERFLEIHSDSLKEINDEIIELARQNRIIRRKRKIIEEVEPEEISEEEKEEIEIIPVEENSKMLVAEVPKAGDRWTQIHFNVDVNRQFFKVQPNSSERAYLFEKISPTKIGQEEVRPVVFSRRNRNIKIEFAAKRDKPYPSDSRPILVVREIGTRIFHYVLLMPRDEGYDEMDNFLQTHRLKSIGRGVIRLITTYDNIIHIWQNCYL